jgi:hypothetical protein
MSTLAKLGSSTRDLKEAIKQLQPEIKDVKLTINIPPQLRREFKMMAARNNIDMTEILISFIEKYLKEEDKKEGK